MNTKKSIILILVAGLSVFIMAFSPNTTNNSAPVVGLNIGDIAPELIYKSPAGKEIALSSLRGKLVLIDFWAAWCPPCRAENPNLVKAYNSFKDVSFENGEGFTIYSVSLDRTKEAWIKAIETDKLDWPYHVSDLLFWSSEAAATYGIRSIPSNFLLDGEGIIIAKDLRREMLHAKLSELQK